jgi:hypothetical protein
VFFERNEVQPLAAQRIVAPCGPSGEEVVAQAKTGFEDRESGATAPALGQAIAGEEDAAGLFKRTFAGMVDVVERSGTRHVLCEVDHRGSDRLGLHVLDASHASSGARTSVRLR